MRENKSKILEYIRLNSPVLPVQVSKYIGTNIIMAGALLSELVRDKQVRITKVKSGGSPFYYIPGQESRLQKLVSFLPQKEKEICEILRNKKVIRDKTSEPWQRVALRSVTDFAIPLQVTSDHGEEIFWKWYLVDNSDIKDIVDDIIGNRKEIKEEKKDVKKESEIQKPLVKEEKKKVEYAGDDFFDLLKNYFSNSKIYVEREEIIRKNREFSFVVKIPSKIGLLKYFVKARNKKSISDADLSLAYSEGQQVKLPVLFLTNGKLTKKAEKYLEDRLKGQLVFKQI